MYLGNTESESKVCVFSVVYDEYICQTCKPNPSVPECLNACYETPYMFRL